MRRLRLTQPILAAKAIDPRKLAHVVGHENVTDVDVGSNRGFN
jgi:hypothetical protein